MATANFKKKLLKVLDRSIQRAYTYERASLVGDGRSDDKREVTEMEHHNSNYHWEGGCAESTQGAIKNLTVSLGGLQDFSEEELVEVGEFFHSLVAIAERLQEAAADPRKGCEPGEVEQFLESGEIVLGLRQLAGQVLFP